MRPGQHIDHAADPSDGPHHEALQCQGITPTKDLDVVSAAANDLADSRGIPTALLDILNVVQFCQSLNQVRGHVHAGASRIVVQHDRNADCIIDRLEMAIQFVRRGQRIIGRCQQDPGRAQGFGLLGVGNDLACAAGIGAHQNGHTTRGRLQRGLDHGLTLGVAQCVVFTGAAQRNETMDTRLDQVVGQGAQGLQIDLLILGHGRDHCAIDAFKCAVHSCLLISTAYKTNV